MPLISLPPPSSVLTMTRISFFSSGFCAQVALTGSSKAAERKRGQASPQTEKSGVVPLMIMVNLLRK